MTKLLPNRAAEEIWASRYNQEYHTSHFVAVLISVAIIYGIFTVCYIVTTRRKQVQNSESSDSYQY